MFIVVQKAKNPSNGGHLSLSPSVRFENMKYVNVNAITLPPMVPTKQPNSVKYTTNVCFVFRVAWFENQILFFFFCISNQLQTISNWNDNNKILINGSFTGSQMFDKSSQPQYASTFLNV